MGRTSETVSMSIGLASSEDKLPESSSENDDSDEAEAEDEDIVVTCITFSGSSKLLPNAQVLPVPCKQRNVSRGRALQWTLFLITDNFIHS